MKTRSKTASAKPEQPAQHQFRAARDQSRGASPPSDLSWRVGFGNDVHRLVPGRKLVLGGIHIPSGKGPLGHSDGDALAHAVCDALLGAAALGDIGHHFPDTSPRWRNASSLNFLTAVRQLLDHAGLRIANLDATISLEKPRLARHIARIRASLAKALGIRMDQVSVKAKSGEGMGEIGRGEAVRAEAVALLIKEGSADLR